MAFSIFGISEEQKVYLLTKLNNII